VNTNWQLTMMTYVFAKYSLSTALQAIHDAGFTRVELWGGSPHAAVEHLNPKSIKNLKECLQQNQLQVIMYTPEQISYPVAISSRDDSIRQYSINYFKRAVEIASEIGAPRLLVSSGTHLLDDHIEVAYDNCLNSLKIISSYAGEHGIKVVIEPLTQLESGLIFSHETLLNAWFALAEYPIEVMVDLVPMHLNQESLESYFHSFGSHLSVIHFVDCDGETIRHLIPGEGKINFDQVISILRNHHFSGYLSFEIGAAYHQNPFIATQQCLSRVQSLLQAPEKGTNNPQ